MVLRSPAAATFSMPILTLFLSPHSFHLASKRSMAFGRQLRNWMLTGVVRVVGLGSLPAVVPPQAASAAPARPAVVEPSSARRVVPVPLVILSVSLRDAGRIEPIPAAPSYDVRHNSSNE